MAVKSLCKYTAKDLNIYLLVQTSLKFSENETINVKCYSEALLYPFIVWLNEDEITLHFSMTLLHGVCGERIRSKDLWPLS
jgi:hypothetical protein